MCDALVLITGALAAAAAAAAAADVAVISQLPLGGARQNDNPRANYLLSRFIIRAGFKLLFDLHVFGWLGSRVVSVLDSGAEGPGFKSQPRRCRVTGLGKLFTPIVPLFTKQQNWQQPS